MSRKALSVVALAALLLGAPTVTLAGDVEQAKSLFDQGLSDFMVGRYEKACPAIDRSYRLDPRPGTLFTLAECEARRGRVATAVARYTEYLALYRQFVPKKQAEQKDRADASRSQIETLSPLVPLVTLRLPEGCPEDVEVRHDGETLPVLSLTAPLAVNPGENVFTVQSPGGPLIEHRIDLKAGDRKELRLSLDREAAPAPTVTPTATVTALPAAIAPIATAPPSAATALAMTPDVRPFRLGTISLGAVGVIGLGLGAAAGVLALDAKSVVSRECQRDGARDVCSPHGVVAGEQLKVLGAASTASFVIGAVGLAAAGVVLLATPSSHPGKPPVRLSLTPSGLLLDGRF